MLLCFSEVSLSQQEGLHCTIPAASAAEKDLEDALHALDDLLLRMEGGNRPPTSFRVPGFCPDATSQVSVEDSVTLARGPGSQKLNTETEFKQPGPSILRPLTKVELE